MYVIELLKTYALRLNEEKEKLSDIYNKWKETTHLHKAIKQAEKKTPHSALSFIKIY